MKRTLRYGTLLLPLLVAAVLWPRGEGAAPEALEPTVDAPVAQRYRLLWEAEQKVGTAGLEGRGVALEGRAHLEAVLRLERRGPDVLVASLDDFDRHEIEIQGEPLLPDLRRVDETFGGRHAVVHLAPNGLIREIRFQPTAPALFVHSMQSLLSELQLARRPGVITERNQHGSGPVHYTREGARLRKVREGYDRLLALTEPEEVEVEAVADVTLDGAGWIERWSATERIEGEGVGGSSLNIRSRLELTRLGSVPPSTVALARFVEIREPGRPHLSAAAHRRALRDRVDGLTTADLVADLRKFGPGGTLPDHNRWLWRAVGLLLLDPSASAEVAAAVHRASDSQTRALGLDLLASAGTPAAQEAMRVALEDERVRSDEAYDQLIQRVGVLEEPDAETLAFVANEDGLAAAMATGAVIDKRPDDPRAATANASLVVALEAASGAHETAALLYALGNAGRGENVEALAPFAEDPRVAVRAAAAVSLRKTPGEVARRVLRDLTEDTSEIVRTTAARVLRELSATSAREAEGRPG